MGLFYRRRSMTAEDVEREIQIAIDDAWERSRNIPAAKAYWQYLFPSGEKPSQEEFIRRLAQELEAGREPPLWACSDFEGTS